MLRDPAEYIAAALVRPHEAAVMVSTRGRISSEPLSVSCGFLVYPFSTELMMSCLKAWLFWPHNSRSQGRHSYRIDSRDKATVYSLTHLVHKPVAFAC